MFCVKRPADHRKHLAMRSSLQHVTPRDLAAALLGQVGTIPLSLLLSSPDTTYTIISHSDSDTVYNCFAVLKAPPCPWNYHCTVCPVNHSLLPIMLLYMSVKCYHHFHPLNSSFLPSPLWISLEWRKHASEGWAVSPQKNLTVVFHVI